MNTNKIRRIIVLSYCYYCGGTVVLSELTRCLRKLGYDARIFLGQDLPSTESECKRLGKEYRTDGPHKLIKSVLCAVLPLECIKKRYRYDDIFPRHSYGIRRQWFLNFNRNTTLVLYPDVVYGNPLDAKNVVRWVLFGYRHSGNTSAYEKTDLFIGYRDVFNQTSETTGIENVHIANFDSSLYRRTNYGERKGNCYILRKGESRNDLPAFFDGPVIDGMSEEEKVRMFNKCERCYSYDTQTFYSSIAAVCGCQSIIIPEPGKTMADYRSESEPSFGVAWGESEEELARAERTVPQLLDRVSKFQKQNIEAARKFIEVVESHFDMKVKRSVKSKLWQRQ